MKGILGYILIAASAMLTTIACDKSLSDKQPKHGLILLNAVEEGATKALLDGNTFMTEGNQIVVYDYYTQGPKTTTTETGYYINGAIAQSTGETETGTVWPFTDDARYEWTEDGVHKFFGWLVKDNNENPAIEASTFFGDGFGFNTDPQNPVLTIPETTINQSTDQFDFMYSNIEERNLNRDPYYGEVPLEFYHLFTAFSISAADNAKFLNFKINSIELIKMNATNSASINYSPVSGSPVVQYGSGISGKGHKFDLVEDIVLESNYKDLSTGRLVKDYGREYFLIWPQPNMACTFRVVYSVASEGETEYQEYTKDITIPYAWAAGKKNNVNLDFSDKKIDLTCTVEPWNVVDEELDFTDQVTVPEGGTIIWDEDTILDVNYSTGEVFLTNDKDKEATCTFTILTPKGATWTASLISKKGHPDAFRFVEGTKYGPVGVESTIKLVVTNEDPISPLHECELLITVQTADGRTIIVDDALTPEYDENNQPTEYARFRIIQNLNN